MMTMERSVVVEQLIEDRLDAIDRLLLRSGKPRAERLSIVEETRAQIEEMLTRKVAAGEVTRQDVLAVFSEMDPPESYTLAEGNASAKVDSSSRNPVSASVEKSADPVRAQPLAYTGAGLSILAMGANLLSIVLMFLGGSESQILFLLLIAFAGLLWIPSVICLMFGVMGILKSPEKLHGITAAAIGFGLAMINMFFTTSLITVNLAQDEVVFFFLGLILSGVVSFTLALLLVLSLYRTAKLQQVLAKSDLVGK